MGLGWILHSKKITLWVSVAIVILSCTYKISQQLFESCSLPPITPWTSIGGCGVGGAGDKGGGALEWVGQGVSGGYIDTEIMPSTSITSNTSYGGMIESQTITLPLFFNARLNAYTYGLRIPMKSVSFDEGNHTTVGFGDINLLFGSSFGAFNQYNFQFGLGLPTGKHDIHDKVHHIMDNSGQLGSGVFMGNVQLTRTFDQDWGLFMLGVNYSAGLLYFKSVDWAYDSSLVRVVPTKSKLSSARTGLFSWQNDVLTENSDNFGFKAILGIKNGRIFHSFHLMGSFPLQRTNQFANDISYSRIDSFTVFLNSPGPNVWNESEARLFLDTARTITGAGDTLKTYKNVQFGNGELTSTGEMRYWYADRALISYKVWPSVTIGYGQEIFNEGFPIFWGVSFPFEFDKESGYGFTGFAAQIGIKSVIF